MRQIHTFHRADTKQPDTEYIANCRNTFGWLMDVSYNHTKPYTCMF